MRSVGVITSIIVTTTTAIIVVILIITPNTIITAIISISTTINIAILAQADVHMGRLKRMSTWDDPDANAISNANIAQRLATVDRATSAGDYVAKTAFRKEMFAAAVNEKTMRDARLPAKTTM